MKNAQSIRILVRQIGKTCERIENLTDSICEAELSDMGSVGVCRNIMLNELENTQVLTLKLTEMITAVDSSGQDNSDGDGGSAFFAGELNHDDGSTVPDEADKDSAEEDKKASPPPF